MNNNNITKLNNQSIKNLQRYGWVHIINRRFESGDKNSLGYPQIGRSIGMNYFEIYCVYFMSCVRQDTWERILQWDELSIGMPLRADKPLYAQQCVF